MDSPKTLFEKVWAEHVVVEETAATPAVLYVDLHIIHEVTTPQAFSILRKNNIPVRRPDLVVATMDHSTPIEDGIDVSKSALGDGPVAAAFQAITTSSRLELASALAIAAWKKW